MEFYWNGYLTEERKIKNQGQEKIRERQILVDIEDKWWRMVFIIVVWWQHWFTINIFLWQNLLDKNKNNTNFINQLASKYNTTIEQISINNTNNDW